MHDIDLIAYAFGRGADARLAGRPMDACPFHIDGERPLYESFRRGYKSAANEWAVDAKWPVRELVKVRA